MGHSKLLTSNMTNGIHPLDEETLNSLKQKHLQSNQLRKKTLIDGKPSLIHPFIFDGINKELVDQVHQN